MKKIFLFAAVFCAFTVFADLDNVRNEWMSGYAKLEAADKAAKANKKQEAIQLYRSALGVFESIQRRYPQWNPTLLSYRVNYCKQTIEQLSSAPVIKPETLSANELIKLNKEYANTIAQLSEERRFLESRVEVLTESLNRARSEAAKSANVEASLTTAAKTRKKLEETNNLLQLRLREANKEIESLKKNGAGANQNAASQTQKLQKTEELLRQSQNDLAKAQDNLKASRKNVDSLNDAYATLQKEKDKQDASLKKIRELAINRQTEIDNLQQRLDTARKHSEELEKTLRKREATLDKLKQKGAIEEDGQMSDLTKDLQNARAKNLALNEELMNMKANEDKLQKELVALREQNAQLAGQITSDTQGWKDSQNTGKAQTKQLQQLQTELKQALDAKVNLQHRLDAQIELTRKQEENLAALTADDSGNPNLARTVILQKAQIAKLASDINALNVQLQDTDPLARKSQLQIQNLNRQLADAKTQLTRAREQIDALRAEQDKHDASQNNVIAKATDELDQQKPDRDSRDPDMWKTLYEKNFDLAKQALAKEAEARARVRKIEDQYLETQEQLDERDKDLVAAKNALAIAETAAKDAQEKLKTLDVDLKTQKGLTEAASGLTNSLADSNKDLQTKNLAINALQAKVAALEAQLREADTHAVASNLSVPEQIKQLTAKLEQEQKHRRALEMALADKETAPQTLAAEPQKTDIAPDMAKERQRREREKEAVLQGYLRQAIDAEKQEKVEAAQFNYQKVLDLDPNNRIAIQRLGIIAANLGNDQDTIRYLQRAFRLDPDDPDTLFALGYSLIRQAEPDWAISMLARAIALNPQDAAIARTYGTALATLGWTQAAEIQLEKAYKLKTDDPEAPLALAILIGSAKPPRLEEARKWYAIALKNGAQPDPGLDAVLK